MRFGAPAASLSLLLIPLVVFLYILRSRKTDFFVPSIRLWDQIAQDTQAQKPWQKLIFSILLLLQIFLIAIFALTLAKPSFLQKSRDNDLVLVVDVSLSMKATDIDPSRLESAKRKALEAVNRQTKTSKIALIAVSNTAEILNLPTTDHSLIKKKIAQLEANGSSTDLASALMLANNVANLSNKPRILLLSDGADLRYVESDYPIEHEMTARAADNVFIASLHFELSRAEPDKLKVLAGIENAGKTGKSVLLSIYDKNMDLMDAVETTVSPKKISNVEFSAIDANHELAFVKAEVEDKLPDDNSAWILLQKREKPKVTIYTKGNLFLQKAFEPLASDVRILKPADWKPSVRKEDITVFDGFTPKKLPEQINALFVDPSSGNEFFDVEGAIDQNAPQSVSMTNPLLNGTDILGINILQSKSVKPTNFSEAIIQGAESPLILAGEQGLRKAIVLAFDLGQSDFPLQYSFPIFVANAIDFFLKDEQAKEQVLIGIDLKLPSAAEELEIVSPSKKTSLHKSGRHTYYEFAEAGPYKISYKNKGRTVQSKKTVASYIGSEESDIAPSPLSVRVKSKRTTAGSTTFSELEIWKPLLMLILAFLIIEWLLYKRGAT